MICYDWEGLSKPLVLIGASYVGGVQRCLIFFSYIVWLCWGYDTSYSHRLEWCVFSQGVLVIWWLFPLCALVIILEVRLFGRLLLSLWCGLCGERGMLGFFRILARCMRWCGTWFISLFLFGSTILMFSNLFPWVLFSLVGYWFVHLRVGLTWWGVELSFLSCMLCIVFLFLFYKSPCKAEGFLGVLIWFVFHGEDFSSFLCFLVNTLNIFCF